MIIGLRSFHETSSLFFTDKKFLDNKTNSTPLKFKSSFIKVFFNSFFFSFWNSSVPMAEITFSERNFNEFGFGVV